MAIHKDGCLPQYADIMRELSNEFVKETANTIWSQIKASVSADVIGSWGISELYAQEVEALVENEKLHMAALVMRVNGLRHSGYVLVCLNEGKDLYCIYTTETEDAGLQEYQSEVYCDMLGSSLDRCIERGDMTEEQYQQRIQAMYFI